MCHLYHRKAFMLARYRVCIDTCIMCCVSLECIDTYAEEGVLCIATQYALVCFYRYVLLVFSDPQPLLPSCNGSSPTPIQVVLCLKPIEPSDA